MTIQRIPIGTPDKIEDIVQTQIKRYVGTGTYISKYSKVNDGKYIFEIGNTFMDFIEDSRDDVQGMIFSRAVDNIFSVDVINEKDQFEILMPDFEFINESMRKKYSIQMFQSETTLVEIAHSRFVNIPTVKTTLSPIYRIFECIDKEGKVSITDITHRKGPKKVKSYLNFLVQIDFLTTEGENYIPSVKYKKYLKSDPRNIDNVISGVLESGYEYLQEYFHLTLLKPFVRISNAYYYPSQKFGDRLQMNDILLKDYFKRIYCQNRNLDQLRFQVKQMKDVNIFEPQQDFIVGDEQIYKDYTQSFCNVGYC